MIPDDDRGFTLGDGLFETVLAVHGRLIEFEAHVARLTKACGEIGLPAPSPAQLEEAAQRALGDAGLSGERAAVRLTWSAGSGGRGLPRPAVLLPRLVATAAASQRPEGAATLITSSVCRNDASPASRLKTLSYIDNVLARREAQAAGADDALMLNTMGHVACASVANIFWLRGGRLFTPPVAAGVLPGIVRAETIEAAQTSGIEVMEDLAGPEALFEAEGVFLTNSLIGIRLVAALDGRPLNQQALQATEWLRRGRR